jgi:parallel beta-helix repeat protein
VSKISPEKPSSSVVLTLGVFGIMLFGGASHAMAQSIAQPIQLAQASGSSPQYNYLFVNSNTGIDTAEGNVRSPLKTITRALQIVQPNTIILLAPGTYSAQTGEAFPLQMRPGTTIKGEPRDRGQTVVIQGGGIFLSRTFARQSVTIVGANQSGLTGVTVSNPDAQGYGLWTESTSPVISDNTFTRNGHDGASVVGSSAPILRNNYFYQNGANGVTVYGTSRPELHDNIFEQTGFGINIAQSAAPRIVGNRITQNKDGIVIQGKAQPILRNNIVDGNARDGMVAIAQSRPNLGTSADPGNNTFTDNGQFDLNTQKSIQKIPAFGNQITGSKTIGRLDFSNTSTVADAPVSVASAQRYSPSLPTVVPASFSPSRSLVSVPAQPSASFKGTTVVAPISKKSRSAVSSSRSRRVPLSKQPKSQVARIEIPVLAPSNFSTASNRSAFQLNSALPRSLAEPIARRGSDGAINIPVPPPERIRAVRNTKTSSSRRLALPSSTGSQAMSSRVARPTSRSAVSASGTLRVPKASIPVGRTAGTSVKVWRGAPVSPNRSAAPVRQDLAFGLRYRVVVQARSEGEQAQIQSAVPGSFPVFRSGQSVLQAGVFSDRIKAHELLQTLTNQGLRATVEQL